MLHIQGQNLMKVYNIVINMPIHPLNICKMRSVELNEPQVMLINPYMREVCLITHPPSE